MFKKISLFLAALLVSVPAFAGSIKAKPITATLLDNSPTAVSGVVDYAGVQKGTFFVTNDETEVGSSVSVAVTVTSSFDGTNYASTPFYDTAGGVTPQTSETISADGVYMFWLDQQIQAPYVKVTITATGTDADDTALVTCSMLGQI